MRGLPSVGQVLAGTVLLLQIAAATPKVLELSKQKWTLTSPDHENISIKGKVPSYATVDLYNADLITDP